MTQRLERYPTSPGRKSALSLRQDSIGAAFRVGNIGEQHKARLSSGRGLRAAIGGLGPAPRRGKNNERAQRKYPQRNGQ